MTGSGGEQEDPGGSRLDKAWAVLGLLTALALAAMSVDLLRGARPTGGEEVSGGDDGG